MLGVILMQGCMNSVRIKTTIQMNVSRGLVCPSANCSAITIATRTRGTILLNAFSYLSHIVPG